MRRAPCRPWFLLSLAVSLTLVAGARRADAAQRTFPAGSLIIPMDLSYQSTGTFQAYGLIYQL